MQHLGEQLWDFLEPRSCLMGLGNPDYGDDGLGVYLSRELAGRLNGTAVIDAGTMPERYIDAVLGGKYDHVLFIDAVEFGAEPGAVVLLDMPEIEARFPQISTHKISVGLFAELADEKGIDVRLLGVQPRSIQYGAGLSPEVQRTVDILVGLFDKLRLDGPGGECGEEMRALTGNGI